MPLGVRNGLIPGPGVTAHVYKRAEITECPGDAQLK